MLHSLKMSITRVCWKHLIIKKILAVICSISIIVFAFLIGLSAFSNIYHILYLLISIILILIFWYEKNYWRKELPEYKEQKEKEDTERQKLKVFKETSIQKLISVVYKENEGISKIALSGLLLICRENNKSKLIEIVVHHILNAAQNGLGGRKSCDFLRATLWTVGAMPMDEVLKAKVVEITSKKALAVTNREESDIISTFSKNLNSQTL